MTKELKQKIIDTMQLLHSRIGEIVIVEDWICTSGRSYDRHQTRYGRVTLKVEEFSIRMSGGIATMRNEKQQVEFRTDAIKHIENKEGELIIEINMKDNIWRRIKIIKNKPSR